MIFRLHLGAVYLFLYGPILVLMALSFNRSGLPTAWTGFTLDWYARLAEGGPILAAARNTLIVAAASTALATLIGTLLAVGIEGRRRSAATEALLFAPMIIPDIVLAIGLLSLYTLLGLTLGLHSIVLSHTVFNIAFVAAVVRARMRQIDPAMLEASRDLGASELTTFRRVLLPNLAPAVIAGALLSFTLSVDEFIIAFFTAGAGPSSTTLPMQIFAMIRFGVTPEINAMASIVMLASFVLVLLAQRANRGVTLP